MFLKWYSSTMDALKNKSELPFNTGRGRLGVCLYDCRDGYRGVLGMSMPVLVAEGFKHDI